MAKEQGSVWVEGDNLHFVDETGQEWKFNGRLLNATTGQAGSLWIEGKNLIYLDEGRNKRVVSNQEMSSVNGQIGSLWLEGKLLHWIDSLGVEQLMLHSNVAYGNHQDAGYFDNSVYDNYSDYRDKYDNHKDAGYFDNETHTNHQNGWVGHENYRDKSPDGYQNCYDCSSHDNEYTHDNTTYINYSDYVDKYDNHQDAGYFDNSVYSNYSDYRNTPHSDNPVIVP